MGNLVSLRGRIGFRGYKQTDLVGPGSGAITFSPADIDDEGHVSLINNKYLSWEKYEESPEIKVQPGDILFTKTASIGKIGYVKELKEKATINPQFALLTPVKEVDGYFIFNSVRTDEFMKKVRDITGGSSVPTMSQEKLKEITIMIPSLVEQVRIGEFLTKLDDTITLHQRKYIIYCQNIFSSNTNAWEQRKFSSVFQGLQNNTLSRAELNYESGNVMNVHYGDVLIKFGDYIDASKTEIPYITDDTKAEKFISSLLQDGDIVIADTAEDDTVGKCTEIQGSEGLKLLSGLHTIACRPKGKYGPMFLGYYINSPAYHDQLKPLMQGIKVTSISKSALQDTDMIMPKSIEEQTQIGEYFSYLDDLITLHQRKQIIIMEDEK